MYEAYRVVKGKEKRIAVGETQAELARKLGVSRTTVRERYDRTQQNPKSKRMTYFIRKIKSPTKTVYAAYELKSGYELCIGVADTAYQLGRMLGVTAQYIHVNMERAQKGWPLKNFYVMKVTFENDDE